ncbi:MAG: site-specific integrase [Bdellovibrionaceae bacterium]|nr:site-specific integrase [Pseudobdellovibrionaceae bacterium]
MSKKTYRRFVRMGNDLISSPRFTRKSDADEWYEQMKRRKQFVSQGMVAPRKKNEGLKFIDYAREWMKNRMANYPQATWQSDEQRLRDYVLPYLSEAIIDRISSRDVREVLEKVTELGNSTATRVRVKALLSKIFSDAFNKEYVLANPVYGIKFDEKRVGVKKPVHLESTKDCINFLAKAKEMGKLHLTAASLAIMTGLRKSEIIALTWDDIDLDNNVVTVSKRLEQATMTIREGTKAGELEIRKVPFSDDLKRILKDWKKISNLGFVFKNTDGSSFMRPRMFYELISSIGEAASIKIHVHGLRHTFGREFAAKTGNLKALQSILGHASSSTTDIYSELSGDRIKGYGEAVTFSVKRGKA